jgi:predicted CXXCH cytochrome family protein
MRQQKKLFYVGIFLLLTAIFVGTGGICSAAAKPSYKNCLECHDDLKNEMMLKGAHAPFKKFQCGSCHDPHTSNYKFLVKKDVGTLCKGCHEKKAFKLKFAHAPVEEGDCTKCHDPHASKDRNLLVAEGKDLCFACHESESVFVGGKPHAPAGKGECLKCHDPHGSDNASLARKDDKKLCVDCHHDVKAMQSDKTKKAHRYYPVLGAACVSCHNPHGSKHDNLIRKNRHILLKKDGCTTCHNAPGSKDPLGMNKKGAIACLQCHKNVAEDFNKINNHVQDGIFCTNCHNPHASDQAGMKKSALTKICYTCHQDTQWRMYDKKTKYLHPGLKKKGNCNDCHDPHGSNFRLLFPSDEFTVCTECHKKHGTFTHPLGVDAVDPRSKRDITCITCHNLMGSQYEFALRFDRRKQLCIQCHTSY